MVEASYATYPTLGWPKGQQQTPESCCSTTRQMRNQVVLDVNEALTFTVINSKNTKLSQHNRWIGGGATPTEIRGGIYSGTLNWLAQGPLPYWNASIMWHVRDHHFGTCWSDGEGREDETNVVHLQIYMVTWLSHGHVTMRKYKKSREISSWCTWK